MLSCSLFKQNINDMKSKTVLVIITVFISMGISSAQQNKSELDKNKQIVAGFYREVINNKNLDSIGYFLTDDFTHNGDKKGVEGQKAVVKMFLTAFSNLVNTIEISMAENDLVCVHENWTGKHTGEFMGVPASDKNVKWTSTAILRIRDGKIATAWDENDFLGLFMQIGKWPSQK
jgi:predicted ester cyclase